ncbi:MAG: adenosylhomocysteinase, partial [Planctomycetota bacterium]
EVFITVTGNKHVLRAEHFAKMKDGAIVCNSGHFDVEIDIPALTKMAKKVIPEVRPLVTEFQLPAGRNGRSGATGAAMRAARSSARGAKSNGFRSIYLLADGRLVNLSAATGHPASVMDMSFATQALCAEWIATAARGKLSVVVHDVPHKIEEMVSQLKLRAMGVKIDKLTSEQVEYLASSGEGT